MSINETNSFNYLLKYIIIGDSFVGKSNLLLKYTHNQFKPEYQLTIGVEFGSKNIILEDGTKYRIQIWDTAGQENFRSITRSYYKNSTCALIVYDITNRETFNNVQTWIEDCLLLSPKEILFVLVGNKIDLKSERKVTTSEAKEYAEKMKILFFETSAKTGENIEKVFEESLKVIDNNIKLGKYDLTNDISGIKLKNGNNSVGSISEIEEKDIDEKKCC